MRLFIAVVSMMLFLVSCEKSTPKNEMWVKGEIKGLRKGNVYLQKNEDSLIVSIDSIKINGQTNFEFRKVLTEPEVHYLTMTFEDSSDVVQRLPFFGEPGEISIATTLENYQLDASINGEINQTKWNEYRELMQRFQNQNLELIEENLNALKEGNDSILKAVEQRQNKLVKGSYLATVNFAKNNGDLEIAPYIMLTEAFDLQTKYLDTVYNAMSSKIKDSKYGKELESFIKDRKTGN